MAQPESSGAPAPLDVDPSVPPNYDGPADAQTSTVTVQRPLLSPAEAAVHSVPCVLQTYLIDQAESVGAPTPFDVDPNVPPFYDTGRPVVALSREPLPSTETVRRPPLSEAEAAAHIEPQIERRRLRDYLPLFHAANRGDWEAAANFVGLDVNFWTTSITIQGHTSLMVAARACRWQFVKKLVELLPSEALAIKDTNGLTAFHFVALGGSVKIAKAMVEKNMELPQITSAREETPLLICLQCPCKEMVWYLVSVTRYDHPNPSCPFTGSQSKMLFALLTIAGFNDITLYLIRRYPNTSDEGRIMVLHELSSIPSSFLSGSNLTFIERWIYKYLNVHNEFNSLGNMERLSEMSNSIQSRSLAPQVLNRFEILLRKAAKALELLVPTTIKQIRDAKLQHMCSIELVKHVFTHELVAGHLNYELFNNFIKDLMSSATKFGIVEIIETCFEHFPFLVSKKFIDNKNILQASIEGRHDKIFNLINETPIVSMQLSADEDESKNTIWHLAGKLAPSSQLLSISGVALQMQRELQWFKEVEKLVHPFYKSQKNFDKKTAMDAFIEEHKNLAEQGEKWMKDTANYCMIASTLIATVVFAAAFTAPGGNISDKGIPVFLKKISFKVFIIADALALFSSSTSLLMFLSILTARYAYEDFLLKLPRRLIVGLGSLFLAIITMMVAFGATLYMVLNERWQWVYIPIIVMGFIPVGIFVKLQMPLFIDMVQSTYFQGVFKTRK